ncbi:MAG TPA: UDP-N-acetylmuramate dehydrogenase [Candidatus Cloacimonadota bacterium]|nr:UDP-N-acetylmuramate dehydrogenase [Candidatus Cloacimonadota bacterium]
MGHPAHDNRQEAITLKDLIKQHLPELLDSGALLFDEPMKAHTSFNIGGPADLFCLPSSQAQIIQVLRFAQENSLPWMILGKGSNLLVSDKGIRGIVISTQKYTKLSLDENYVSAFCGVSLRELCEFCRDRGLAGLEFASGIPGSVGGAVFMNAGAYGGEIKDALYCSKALEPTPQGLTAPHPILHLKHADHQFDYRTSSLQTRGLVHLSSVFKLRYDSPEEINARMLELDSQRWEKQPMELPSAGSVFKRPEGHFTGKLIDDCGLRGFQIGGARISDKHCGFIVNVDNASAADVDALIKHAQTVVQQRFGVSLRTEIRKVGEW